MDGRAKSVASTDFDRLKKYMDVLFQTILRCSYYWRRLRTFTTLAYRAVFNTSHVLYTRPTTMKRIVFPLISLIIGLIIALGFAELIVRLVPILKGPEVKEWSDRPPFYFQSEKSTTLQDYPHGQKSANAYRIAVVGDSYSFAPFMQFTDAFPKILERMLNLNDVSRKVEVVNYGVPAYSTSHEVSTVDKAIKEGADLILLQITLNDPEIKGFRPTKITFFDRFGKLKTEGWKKWLLDHWKTLAFVATRIHNEKTVREYKTYFNDLFNKKDSYENFASSLSKLNDIAKGKNIPLRAIVFPLFGLPLDKSYPFHSCHQKVHDLLDKNQISYLDLFNLYEGIPIDRLQVIPGVDRHPNEIAHRMAAEQIYSWLAERKDIPEDFLIRKKFLDRIGLKGEKPTQ